MAYVYLVGDVDEEASQRVIEELASNDADLDDDEGHDLLLCTYGGGCSNALAILGAMRILEHKVNVHAMGRAYSAGLTVLAGATGRRIAYEGTWMMMHELSVASIDAESWVHVRETDQLAKETKELARLLARFSGQPVSRVERDMRSTTRLTPRAALRYGFVDEVRRLKR